ncbi:polyadenylate-binding protein 2-like protein [Sarcoptes scabiei]|nr:polyadenylate-binding protein 2-like protein [Sarcoptes scabiei]
MTSTATASTLNENHIASTSSPNDHFDVDEDVVDQTNETADDEELEEIKARVREMEEEAEKLKQMQDDITSQISNTGSTDHTALSPEERVEIDSRSIYVGNVDYSATADDLEKHFHGCGSINRVTILCDKYSGHPKGFAYIEFADKDSVETATALDDSLFKGRQIKVNAKRTNRPGLSTTNRPPRRGMLGRGLGRGYAQGRGFAPWFHRGAIRGGRGFR